MIFAQIIKFHYGAGKQCRDENKYRDVSCCLSGMEYTSNTQTKRELFFNLFFFIVPGKILL